MLNGPSAFLDAAVVARAESFLQPFAIVVVLAVFVRLATVADVDLVLRRSCQVLITLLAINAALILVQIVYGVSWFFEPFLAPRSTTSGNVWDRALSMGRYTGIFGMPFDSGLTYSLGLLAWVYLSRVKRRIDLWLVFSLPLLLVGAVASISKVSVILGSVLFFGFLIAGRGVLRRVLRLQTLVQVVVVVAALGVGLYWSDRWSGISRLRRYMPDGQGPDVIALYTEGRYSGISEGEGLAKGFLAIWRESPLTGIGFARPITVDSAYLDMYAMGGFPALVLYFAVLANLGMLGMRWYGRSLEGKFLFFLFLLVLGSSLGAPVVTANRFAPALWGLFVLLATRLHLAAVSGGQAYDRARG